MPDSNSTDQSALPELPFDVPNAGSDLAADIAIAVAAPTAGDEPLAHEARLEHEAKPMASAAPVGRSALGRDTRVKPLKMLVLLTVFAITGVGSLMLLASAMHPAESNRVAGGPAPTTPGADAPAVSPTVAANRPAATKPPSPAKAGAAESSDRVPKPKWTMSTNSRKAGYAGAIVFELAADQDIEVWRKRVRPVLTMRCGGKAPEVFVMTHSPATIEGNGNLHTVKVGFDDQAQAEQKWEHSVDHDALFAQNSSAMLRQMTDARAMTFTFAPFNAPPATVTFNVDGFDTHRKAAASKCRS